MESLPQEILLNILSRLPSESIIIAKSVCRLWYNLTQDPVLVNMHFSCVLSEDDPCLILHSDFPDLSQLYLVQLSTKKDTSETLRRTLLPLMPEFNVVGSCNGLLCLCDSQHKNAFYLYNPFTRRHIQLPKAVQVSEQEAVAFGFGFHPTIKEYKLVRIVYYRKGDGVDQHHPYALPQSEVQIFSLGSFTWKSIGQVSYQLARRPSHTLVNGRLHWMTLAHRNQALRMIVSFDLEDEQFRKVPEPNCIQFGRRRSHLAILGGCLSSVVYVGHLQHQIWIMKEYDEKDSWIKAFNIGLQHFQRILSETDSSSNAYINPINARVLCLLKNGEILLEYKGRTLVSYEPKTSTFRQIMLPGLPHWSEPIVHMGTLIWIDNIIEL